MLTEVLRDTVQEQLGTAEKDLVDEVATLGVTLRRGELSGGRSALSERFGRMGLNELSLIARSFTDRFHLLNAAEQQHRIRRLRERDRPGRPTEGSIADACRTLKRDGASADDLRALLARLFVMPVLTAHPTEARRRTVLDHLGTIAGALDRIDDPRLGHRELLRWKDTLREAVAALYTTEEARSTRPTVLDEVRAGVHVFERTLLDVTPRVYRELEDALATEFPGEPFDVGPFLRWGTWIGGDRDGHPNVTAEVTRATFEQHRTAVLSRYLEDLHQLGRELSVSPRRLGTHAFSDELAATLDRDRERLPEIAARIRRRATLEPLREKLCYVRARMQATLARTEAGYPEAAAYLEDLGLLDRALRQAGLSRLADGRLRSCRRRAQVFGFHLATLDVRQHSAVHEAATGELLARGGVPGYATLSEEERVELFGRLLERADLGAMGVGRDRSGLAPTTRDLLATLDVVGRARRELGPEACERYVISFTNAVSDVLEVLFLARVAGLAPNELRPVPLLEQLEDLGRAEPLAERLLSLPAFRAASAGELEVMVGYSDSGKQVGYVSSTLALRRAQLDLAKVAERHGVLLTVFHGRGGAVGRGGGPANRAIRAQPAEALRGRLRLTEQGETISARYGRDEIALRDLEQMIHAVLVSAFEDRGARPSSRTAAPAHSESRALVEQRLDDTLALAAKAAYRAYGELLADPQRLARYAVAATPIQEVTELPIASRPSARPSRKVRRAPVAANLSSPPSPPAGDAAQEAPEIELNDLRAIPWVFSWTQSRHGLPGWFGLGSALVVIAEYEGPERAPQLYDEWPFFRALIDNAQLALARADIDVARCYAQLASPKDRTLFELILAEHQRTMSELLRVTRQTTLLSQWPTLAQTVAMRNPFVDILSHTQLELLSRLRAAPDDGTREKIRELLFVTINGIAAGLQTAG
jgi:phosphoenolpyruvate carboxylase